MKDKSMPEYVSPIRDIIFGAFGNPPTVSEFEYRAVIITLHRYSSERGLAVALSWTFGRDYYEVLNDVYRAKSFRVPEEFQGDMDSVIAKLQSSGFADWVKSNPPLD